MILRDDVNKLLNDTLQLLEPQLRKSNVEIVKNYVPTPPKIYGSGGKLQQVFTNLILNARDAMYSGGTITLKTAYDEESGIVIEVADTGEGISAENINKIFDPFYTKASATARLGLRFLRIVQDRRNNRSKAKKEKERHSTQRSVARIPTRRQLKHFCKACQNRLR